MGMALFRRAGSSAAGAGRAEGGGEAPGKSENNPPSGGTMFVFKSSLFPPSPLEGAGPAALLWL